MLEDVARSIHAVPTFAERTQNKFSFTVLSFSVTYTSSVSWCTSCLVLGRVLSRSYLFPTGRSAVALSSSRRSGAVVWTGMILDASPRFLSSSLVLSPHCHRVARHNIVTQSGNEAGFRPTFCLFHSSRLPPYGSPIRYEELAAFSFAALCLKEYEILSDWCGLPFRTRFPAWWSHVCSLGNRGDSKCCSRAVSVIHSVAWRFWWLPRLRIA